MIKTIKVSEYDSSIHKRVGPIYLSTRGVTMTLPALDKVVGRIATAEDMRRAYEEDPTVEVEITVLKLVKNKLKTKSVRRKVKNLRVDVEV